MSKYLHELRCSNHALALSETRALHGPVMHRFGVAVTERFDTDAKPGMCHRSMEYLAEASMDREAVLDAVDEVSTEINGSFRVRVRGIGDASPPGVESLEREAGELIHSRDLEVDLDDPDSDIRLLFTEDTCLIGRVVKEYSEDFKPRKPTKKPFFKPGSMSPRLARALVNIACIDDSSFLLDPMCGTAGILIEALLIGVDVAGFDSQDEMIQGSRRNIQEFIDKDSWFLGVGDARSLALKPDSIDCCVVDLPYGRASKIEGERTATDITEGVLSELQRVVRNRCVVVSDTDVSRAATRHGFSVSEVIEERVHRSLTRIIHVLD